ncbi:MAG TPA: hypothetical protein DEB17_01070 [Chlorobaculum sp.]|uniref:Uncharacterized protein n=1 Tax=Chlorobaculum tepidum (strain ATCC 49652 / DSM 12025 / NBRC 103806 / TLS) TaxID=194439 RepID=Q8KCA4_CHLTE|nr:hypothetical protein CT1520 [Chlorobaculum tepidum TLS]HBU22590.1 hypothetical protein [Chlorobaculum sp.]
MQGQVSRLPCPPFCDLHHDGSLDIFSFARTKIPEDKQEY